MIVGVPNETREAFAEWAQTQREQGNSRVVLVAAQGVAWFDIIRRLGMSQEVAAQEALRAFHTPPTNATIEEAIEAVKGLTIAFGEVVERSWNVRHEFQTCSTIPAPPED